MRDAVVAESARWGDSLEAARQPTRTRDVDFQNEVNRVLGLMTGNNEVFINALRREGYYPSIDPPVLSSSGGVVPVGTQVQLTNQNADGVVHYTTDDSDPRDSGGDVSASALLYATPLELSADTTIKSRVLANGEWSALATVHFQMASPFPLRITELNYNPHDANTLAATNEAEADNDRFEVHRSHECGKPVD